MLSKSIYANISQAETFIFACIHDGNIYMWTRAFQKHGSKLTMFIHTDSDFPN